MELTWQAVGVILAILSHGGFSIWWASRITTQMENIGLALTRMDRELEKRDVQIKALWEKMDSLKDLISQK